MVHSNDENHLKYLIIKCLVRDTILYDKISSVIES